MNDELVNELIEELRSTRASFDNANAVFDAAIKSIKWNRINTIILYSLIGLVFILGVFGLTNYFNNRKNDCERGNEFRSTVAVGMEQNAFAIGTALAIVFDAPQEKFDEYYEAYKAQGPTQIIHLREC